MLLNELRSLADHPLASRVPISCALMKPQREGRPDSDVEGLIHLILTRYHDVHRREFPVAIRLARKVEAIHADDPDCPRGLADHLAQMADELESHQHREEEVLFPMILGGGSPMIRFPVRRMMHEHVEVEEQLRLLRRLLRSYEIRPGACGTWRALVAACRKLDCDLREHMRLENEILFAPYLD